MKVQIGTILYRDESGEPTDSVPLYDDLPNDAAEKAVLDEIARIIATMEEDMRSASEAMDFEEAARLRDALVHLKAAVEGSSEEEVIERLRRDARRGSAFGGGRKRQGARMKR